MARILTAGNEFGHYEGDGFTIYRGPVTTSRNQPFGPTSPQRAVGDWYFYLTDDTGLEYSFATSHPSGVDEFYLRCHMYFGGRTDGTWEAMRFEAANDALILRFGTIDGGSGTNNAGYFRPGFYAPTGTTSFLDAVNVYRNHWWHLVEMYIKFGASGRIKLWMNDRLEADWSGSLVGGGAETEMTFFRLSYDKITGGGASYRGYDNIAINDLTGPINNHRIGNGWVLPLRPVGNGTTSQLTNTFGNSTDNFKFINKPTIYNPSGLVGTSTPNDKDTYVLPSLTNEFRGVNSIKVGAHGVRNGASITKAKMLLKPPAQAEIDSPTGAGVGVALPVGSLEYFSQDIESNPNTGNEPFTKAELDGMEAGIQFIA